MMYPFILRNSKIRSAIDFHESDHNLSNLKCPKKRQNPLTSTCLVQLVVVSILLRISLMPTVSASVYRYNICNGLSNQLLYHAASIALSIQNNASSIEIPNHFIVHGVQTTDANVIPNEQNSIPLDLVFNATRLLERVAELGAVGAKLVTFDFTTGSDQQIICSGMSTVQQADAQLMLDILKAFEPSEELQQKIQSITASLQAKDFKRGVCLHHRDGQDWKDHCARWGNISDGIYRGNCLGVPNRTLLQSLEDRGLEKDRWVYYAGDGVHKVPEELKDRWDVVTRNDLMTSEEIQSIQNWKEGQPVRDLWALIDYGVCAQVQLFIGNSVSTFSALQIALREGENSFWYNSQSIPLSTFFTVFYIPIAYTYTELSAGSGKKLLQASIVSVSRHMPKSRIHILYHGETDHEFRSWLIDRSVIIHQHNDPPWQDDIEEMRENGDPQTSHLFLHPGNYFGTWQRIDIPFAVNSEYVLLLDADTIVLRPFTLADFGMEIPRIAMSSEFIPDNKPMNAGVTLFNIPHMRRTYAAFLSFILAHVEHPKYKGSAPSDQGAYLEFYEKDMRFLSRLFNYKPYWSKATVQFKEPFIVHFHGAKPSDYIKHVMGDVCGDAVLWLCKEAYALPTLCKAMQVFAESSREIGEDYGYCEQSFNKETEQQVCVEIMQELVAEKNCTDLPSVIQIVLSRQSKHNETSELSLHMLEPPAISRPGLRTTASATQRLMTSQHYVAPTTYGFSASLYFTSVFPWVAIAVYFWSRKLRKRLI
jgi:hypothetical protein